MGITLCANELVGSPGLLRFRKLYAEAAALVALTSVGPLNDRFLELTPTLATFEWGAEDSRTLLLLATVTLNLLATGFLGCFTAWQWSLAARGRTTIAPNDASYDRGSRLANLAQIFGPRS